jgi:aminoglycoside 3-N-acetyltransferase
MIEPQTPIDVFAPLRRVADTNGHYLLMGVDLTSMTAIHLAENMAGRNYFVRWALSSDGQPMMVFKGGCSEGFHKLEPFVEQTERRMTVGKSLWRSFPAHGLLRVATDAITQQPEITHCGRAGCKCDDAVLGGPILDEFPLEQA